MDDIEIYETLNDINLPINHEKFPYNIQFTQKEIELRTNNGKIYVEADGRNQSKKNQSKKNQPSVGGVRIYF
jgi:hypothetical protein